MVTETDRGHTKDTEHKSPVRIRQPRNHSRATGTERQPTAQAQQHSSECSAIGQGSTVELRSHITATSDPCKCSCHSTAMRRASIQVCTGANVTFCSSVRVCAHFLYQTRVSGLAAASDITLIQSLSSSSRSPPAPNRVGFIVSLLLTSQSAIR